MTKPPVTRLRAQYSTAAAGSVAAFLARHYGLAEPLECTLLQRGFNDSFKVRDGANRRYILRLSCRRARGDADVASETAFIRHLDHAGVPVAAAQPTRDGALFTHALMPEGRRPAVLFQYVEGRAADWQSRTDAKNQGATLARIHNAADPYPDRDQGAYRLDLDHLLHRPVQAILGIEDLPAASRAKLGELSHRMAAAVTAIRNLTWTRCHGDSPGLNARFAAHGRHAGEAVFFDFDDGGPGYLAYDLAVNLWARVFFHRKMHALWHDFVEGY